MGVHFSPDGSVCNCNLISHTCYVMFQVPANHLLSASFMSAPAALAISKLAYPETEISRGSVEDFKKMEKGYAPMGSDSFSVDVQANSS